MKKKVVKAINKASADQSRGSVRALKKLWVRTPWPVRNELYKKLLEEVPNS